jgi:hypothetical protein
VERHLCHDSRVDTGAVSNPAWEGQVMVDEEVAAGCVVWELLVIVGEADWVSSDMDLRYYSGEAEAVWAVAESKARVSSRVLGKAVNHCMVAAPVRECCYQRSCACQAYGGARRVVECHNRVQYSATAKY